MTDNATRADSSQLVTWREQYPPLTPFLAAVFEKLSDEYQDEPVGEAWESFCAALWLAAFIRTGDVSEDGLEPDDLTAINAAIRNYAEVHEYGCHLGAIDRAIKAIDYQPLCWGNMTASSYYERMFAAANLARALVWGFTLAPNGVRA